MDAIRKRLTYANVMSSIAVFLVLGGATAIAAQQLGKKTVGTKQLKANAVTTAKIKKNAVTTKKLKNNSITTAKLKNDSVTGAKVLESSLGTVPSATNANVAATANTYNGLGRKFIRANASGAGASKAASQLASPELQMFSSGVLSLYAKCYEYEGTTYGVLFIRTAQNGAIFYSDYDSAEGDPFLNTNTEEDDREVLEESAGANSAGIYGNHTPGLYAFAPDGTALIGHLQIAVKTGTLTEGDGVYGPGNVCLFSGVVTNASA